MLKEEDRTTCLKVYAHIQQVYCNKDCFYYPFIFMATVYQYEQALSLVCEMLLCKYAEEAFNRSS